MRGLCAAAIVAAVAIAGSVEAKEPALAGEVSVASFWAPWCKPCLAERPMVAALKKTLAADGRVRVYEFNVDEDAGGQLYKRIFSGPDFRVPRLIVVDRDVAGLERLGARVGEDTGAFVRDVSAAVSALEAGGALAPPSGMWKLFHTPKRR